MDDNSSERTVVCTCPEWTTWAVWSDCGVCTDTCTATGTCTGEKTRIRTCQPGEELGTTPDTCSGDPTASEDCAQVCPYWDAWKPWSQCSQTCSDNGDFGSRTRNRDCLNGNVGDGACTGGDSETLQDCGGDDCPAVTSSPVDPDPAWDEWSEWSGCSQTCGQSAKSRVRQCIDNTVVVNDNQCVGQRSEVVPCDVPACPPTCEDITCLDPHSECVFIAAEHGGPAPDGGPTCVCSYPWQLDPGTGTCSRCYAFRPFQFLCHGKKILNDVKIMYTFDDYYYYNSNAILPMSVTTFATIAILVKN